MIKPSRISGSMDSIMDEKDKRLSGIGQLFGVKKVEKTKAKGKFSLARASLFHLFLCGFVEIFRFKCSYSVSAVFFNCLYLFKFAFVRHRFSYNLSLITSSHKHVLMCGRS